MRIRKRTTQKRYIFGDFDRDGTPNLDDPEPFNKAVRSPRTFHQIGYYQEARYSDPEVSLTGELRAIAAHNNRHRPLLRKFYKKYPSSYGRIKTVPSTIRKLRMRYISKINDVAAVTIRSKTRRGARRNLRRVRSQGAFTAVRGTYDNFYARPKNGVYYAYHQTFSDPSLHDLVDRRRHIRIEAQFKSDEMSRLNLITHVPYKAGLSMQKYKKRGKELYRLGF